MPFYWSNERSKLCLRVFVLTPHVKATVQQYQGHDDQTPVVHVCRERSCRVVLTFRFDVTVAFHIRFKRYFFSVADIIWKNKKFVFKKNQ